MPITSDWNQKVLTKIIIPLEKRNKAVLRLHMKSFCQCREPVHSHQ